MKRERYEISIVNGKHYKLRYAQRENVHWCDYRYAKEWRWFLTVDDYYQGDFRLKREALGHIRTL